MQLDITHNGMLLFLALLKFSMMVCLCSGVKCEFSGSWHILISADSVLWVSLFLLAVQRVFIKLNTLSTEAVLVGIKRDNRVSLCMHGKVAWRTGSSTNAVKRSLLGCLCLKINLIKDNVVTNFDSKLDSNNILFHILTIITLSIFCGN